MNMFEGIVSKGKFHSEFFDYPLNDKQKESFKNYYAKKVTDLDAEIEALTNAEDFDGKSVLLEELEAKRTAAKAEKEKGEYEVILGVRPENITRDGSVKLHITNNENLGMNTLVHGKIGNKTIVCKFAEWCNYKVGEEIKIGFDPEMMHFFEHPVGDMPGKAIR